MVLWWFNYYASVVIVAHLHKYMFFVLCSYLRACAGVVCPRLEVSYCMQPDIGGLSLLFSFCEGEQRWSFLIGKLEQSS